MNKPFFSFTSAQKEHDLKKHCPSQYDLSIFYYTYEEEEKEEKRYQVLLEIRNS